MAECIANNFDKLPEKVQNLLFKLAENKEAALNVANAVSRDFDRLSENVRNELLRSSSYNENIREDMEFIALITDMQKAIGYHKKALNIVATEVREVLYVYDLLTHCTHLTHTTKNIIKKFSVYVSNISYV